MRSLLVSLLFTFLSFALLNSYGQSQGAGYFSGKNFVASWNGKEGSHLAILNTNNYTNINNSGYALNYTRNSDSNLASTTFASENTGIERGAVIGGIAGFLAGGIVGGIASPETNLAASAFSLVIGDDAEREVIEEQVPYIIGGTLAGVAIGALIGKRREKMTLRNKEFYIDYKPVLATAPTSTNEMAFALTISISY